MKLLTKAIAVMLFYIKSQFPIRASLLSAIIAALTILSNHVTAQETRSKTPFYFDAGVAVEGVQRKVTTELETTDDFNKLVKPNFTGIIDTTRLKATIDSEYIKLDGPVTDESLRDNFTEFDAAAQLSLINNILRLDGSSSRDYQGITTLDRFTSNQFANQERLRQVKRNDARLFLNSPVNVRNILFSSTLAYSSIDTEALDPEDNTAFSDLDTKTKSADTNLRIGQDGSKFQLNLKHLISENDRAERGNFDNNSIQGSIDYLVYKRRFGLSVNGFIEDTTIESQDDTLDALDREFDFVGVGLVYNSPRRGFIRIYRNKSNNEDSTGSESEESDTFYGGEFSYAINPRSSISGSRSRRFFGNTSALSLNYNYNNISALISHSESIGDQASLSINSELLGIYVCESANASLSDCFLSSELDRLPLDTEVLVPDFENTIEFNDNIVINETSVAQFSLAGRRSSITLRSNLTKNDSLESDIDRYFENFTHEINGKFEFSDRSSVNLKLAYSELEEEFEGEMNDAVVRRYELLFSKNIGKSIELNLTLAHIESEGDVRRNIVGGSNFEGDFEDRRVSLELSYLFESKR